jgi:flagellin
MSISLSAGMRNATYSMNDIQSQIDMSNKRLSTGKKVNSAIDNARAYFAAESFRKSSRDLGNIMDGMDNGLKVIDKATKALDGIRKLVESAQSLARTARSLGDTDASRFTYQNQVAELLTQAMEIGKDSGFNGSNLFTMDGATAPSTTVPVLSIATNDSTDPATGTPAVTKVNLFGNDLRLDNAAGLNLATGTTTNGFAYTAATATTRAKVSAFATGGGVDAWDSSTAGNGNARIDNFITRAAAALTKIQTVSANIATQAQTVQIRQDFTKSWIRTNNEAADNLTLADINEEGANLSALQTKQQLAVQALSLASRADQAILRLF